MNSHEEKAIRILQAWHRVEFFQTYSVPDKEDSSGIDPINIGVKEFETYGDDLLPWLLAKKQAQVDRIPYKKTTYTLHLGLFDKAVLTKIAEKKCKLKTPGDICEEEIEQRLDSEGSSCFAKMHLDEDGALLFDSFSISTLPWAMGQLLNNTVEKMSLAKFDSDSKQLLETISRIGSVQPAGASDLEKKVLDAGAIKDLIERLYEWAGLRPEDLALTGDTPDLLFQIAFFQTESKKVKKDTSASSENTQEEDEADADEVTETEVSQLPILNSFYIRDIEQAINSISSGKAGISLLQYLGTPGKRYTDLYGDNALTLIADHLRPGYTPEGRWPSNPAHNMSLMQQFAVNTALKRLKYNGLLSVNGPPGTGKTTLLRDIIAQNLVERAKILASLKHAGAGLTIDGLLIDSLSGFEMVVASSNNGAVENISKELPQMKSLDNGYETCRYFQPVANKLLAKESKGRLHPIRDPEGRAWGMISAVMGAKKKRYDFTSRFFFNNHQNSSKCSERKPETNFLNLWDFRKQYAGPSFDAAKQNFNAALKDFKALNSKVVEFENRCRSFDPGTCQSQIAITEKEIATLQDAGSDIKGRLAKLTREKKILEAELKAEAISLEKVSLEKPGFFAKLFNLAANKRYKKSLQRQLEVVERLQRGANESENNIVSIEHEFKLNKDSQSKLRDEVSRLTYELERHQAGIDAFKNRFKDHRMPGADQHISDPEVQRNAFWQDRRLNDLRSKVFIAAMELHQAWLMEAMNVSSFRDKMFSIQDAVHGKKTDVDALALWKILFMFVPVISTTFASLGRMFNRIEEEALGWLMIDEAGQAVPQAAIGGLMRAKRTIVVGDPLQIEPVFTSPPGLVEHLMSSLLGEEQKEWSPNFWSVQQLADRMNPYGCKLRVMEKEMWIGIPLWVHRRCIDPMFGIANEIAYDSRMIHGNADSGKVPVASHPGVGDNCWVESSGNCTVKQYKRELGEDTLAILMEAAKGDASIKDIYIITPFKEVKKKLIIFLLKNEPKLIKEKNGWRASDFRAFLKYNIGTIHTFQGKENDTVILVLGCDRENQGGAVWASAKPNLLNVAVTRAKKHLFIVGDPQVWSDKTFFAKAYQALSTNRLLAN